jgi:hypothetical protein
MEPLKIDLRRLAVVFLRRARRPPRGQGAGVIHQGYLLVVFVERAVAQLAKAIAGGVPNGCGLIIWGRSCPNPVLVAL